MTSPGADKWIELATPPGADAPTIRVLPVLGDSVPHWILVEEHEATLIT